MNHLYLFLRRVLIVFLVSTFTFVSTFTGKAIAEEDPDVVRPFLNICTLRRDNDSDQPTFKNPPFIDADRLVVLKEGNPVGNDGTVLVGNDGTVLDLDKTFLSWDTTEQAFKSFFFAGPIIVPQPIDPQPIDDAIAIKDAINNVVTLRATEDEFSIEGNGQGEEKTYTGYLYEAEGWERVEFDETGPIEEQKWEPIPEELDSRFPIIDIDPDDGFKLVHRKFDPSFTPPVIEVSPSTVRYLPPPYSNLAEKIVVDNSLKLNLINDLPVKLQSDLGKLPQTKENLESVSQYTNMHYHGFNVSPLLGGDDVLVEVPSNVTPIPVPIPMEDEEDYRFIPVPPFSSETTPAFGTYEGNEENPGILPGGYYQGDTPRKSKYGGPVTKYRMNFLIPEIHQSGLMWFHSHAHSLSSQQVNSGLSGAIIIKGNEDYYGQFSQPKGPLLVRQGDGLELTSEREEFPANILSPEIKQQVMLFKDFTNRYLGESRENCFLLNSQVNPKITIKPGEIQLWRVGNIGSEKYMNIALADHIPAGNQKITLQPLTVGDMAFTLKPITTDTPIIQEDVQFTELDSDGLETGNTKTANVTFYSMKLGEMEFTGAGNSEFDVSDFEVYPPDDVVVTASQDGTLAIQIGRSPSKNLHPRDDLQENLTLSKVTIESLDKLRNVGIKTTNDGSLEVYGNSPSHDSIIQSGFTLRLKFQDGTELKGTRILRQKSVIPTGKIGNSDDVRSSVPEFAQPWENRNFYILARDGDVVANPVATDSILLPPAARAEFLVVGGKAGSTYNLVSDYTNLTKEDQPFANAKESYLLATVDVADTSLETYTYTTDNGITRDVSVCEGNVLPGAHICESNGESNGKLDLDFFIKSQRPYKIDKILPQPDKVADLPYCSTLKKDLENLDLDSLLQELPEGQRKRIQNIISSNPDLLESLRNTDLLKSLLSIYCVTPANKYQDPLTKKRYFYFSSDDGKNFLKGFETPETDRNKMKEVFDGNRIDKISHVGDIEEWNLVNEDDIAHVFHIHQLDFLVTKVALSKEHYTKNNLPTETYNNYNIQGEGCNDDDDNGNFICSLETQGYRDVINLPPHSTTTVRIPFLNPFITGVFVYHCHILGHEDNGMMNNIKVINSTGFNELDMKTLQAIYKLFKPRYLPAPIGPTVK